MGSPMPSGSGLIVANPTAGIDAPDLADEVAARCAKWLPSVELVRTRYPGHARDIAASPAARRAAVVVAIGGDGTASEVAKGLRAAGGEPPPLLVVPAGSGNSFYRAVWQDVPWQDAFDAVLGGDRATWAIDLARIPETGSEMVLGSCTGILPEVLRVAAGIKDVRGGARYDRAIASVLPTFAPYPGRVTIDGVEAYRGPVTLTTIGGGRWRGFRLEVLPRSVLDDGLLDVCVFGGGFDLLEYGALLEDGSHLSHPAVTYGQGATIGIERTDGLPLSYEHDGDPFPLERTSYTVQVLPGALRVLSLPAAERG
jgi:diacylglycerol kinase (ATP)